MIGQQKAELELSEFKYYPGKYLSEEDVNMIASEFLDAGYKLCKKENNRIIINSQLCLFTVKNMVSGPLAENGTVDLSQVYGMENDVIIPPDDEVTLLYVEAASKGKQNPSFMISLDNVHVENHCYKKKYNISFFILCVKRTVDPDLLGRLEEGESNLIYSKYDVITEFNALNPIPGTSPSK
jgi:hypothetical protein